MRILKNWKAASVGLSLLTSCGGVSEHKTSDKATTSEFQDLLEADSAPQVLSHSDLEANLSHIANSLKSTESSDIPQTGLSLKQGKYVRFVDVDHWKKLSDEYALGYDREGRHLGVFDLTYQNTLSGEFILRSILGTIGAGDANVRTIVQLIRKALHDKKQNLNLADDDEELVQDQASDSDETLLNDEDKIEATLSKLEQDYGDVSTDFQGNWISKIPLKTHFGLTGSVEEFSLEDINFSAMMKDSQHEKMLDEMDKARQHFSERFEVEAPNLLSMFRFRKNVQGGYDLLLTEEAALSLSRSARPMKVIDFVHYKSTFGNALLKTLFKTAIKQATSLIPEPTVASVVKYAVNRWFYLYEQQQRFHYFRALENINLAESGESSPFAEFSADERIKSAIYVLSHSDDLLNHVFKIRNEASWRKTLQADLDTKEKSLVWAQKHGVSVESFGPLFYFTTNEKSQKSMSIFGGVNRLSHKPIVAVNYANPYGERIKRNFLTTIDGVLGVINLPIPLASTVLGLLYDQLVMHDMETAEIWEARLVSYLKWSQEMNHSDFSKELNLLYNQRVNPFELNLDEEKAFIERAAVTVK